jgi:hypothetical protein
MEAVTPSKGPPIMSLYIAGVDGIAIRRPRGILRQIAML